MRVILSLILMYGYSAHAQFGTGLTPGMQCPYPYGPSQSAYRGDDEIRNLVGGLANAERKLERQEQKLSELNREISDAKNKIKRVIKSPSAMSEIERHYKYKANPDDYSQACGRRERTERTASAGGPGANIVHRPSRGGPAGGEEDPGRYAVPADFCQGGVNDWQHVVAADGMVLDSICDYEIPLSRNRPEEARSQECREGLDKYYAKQAKKEALEAEVRSLKDKVAKYNDDKERITDQIAEGTYCPHCASQRRGQNTMGTGSSALQMFGLLASMMMRQPQRPQQPVLVAVPRRGPPNMMPLPYGGAQRAPAALPFPGPQAYPGRPYSAPMPGYYGVQPGAGPGQGYYGGAPGGIGQGSFGCQGTSPFSAGNPLAAQFNPFQNSQANPFANPFANDPFAAYQNQNLGQHPLLNPGYGPGFGPQLGNGIPGYGQFDPFAPNAIPLGQNAPGMLPFPGANPLAPYGNQFGGPNALPYPNAFGQSAYGQNGYANSPYALPYPNQFGGNQFGNQFGGGSPYALPYPYGGAGSAFGLGGPQYQPYPYATNMPYQSGGYNNPWGAPYALNPVQNYGYQMNQMRQGVSAIGGGLYGGGVAPAIMPYIGSPSGSPVYNQPGTPLNPSIPRVPTNAPGVIPAR